MVIAILVIFDVPLHLLWQKSQVSKTEQPTIIRAQDGPVKVNSMGKGGFFAEKVTDKNKKIQDMKKEEGEDLEEQTHEIVVKSTANLKDHNLEAITLADRRDWKLPNFDLLDDSQTEVDSGNIEANVAIIKKTLADFDIEGGNVRGERGSDGDAVTLYCAEAGVKLTQIAALQNNLAMALAAHSLRMELPIPGKSLVGIEVPNKATRIVGLREVMQTHEFVDNKSKLAIALGRDVSGKAMFTDLAKMPHLLIAGATGTGKSVAINSLFVSLLYRNTPQDVKFIVIDPKRVELTLYNGIPHLLTPVVTDHEKAVNALKWAVAEMDRRYKMLAEANKRNITEYNESSGLPLAYIVILVDELADLMAVAQSDVDRHCPFSANGQGGWHSFGSGNPKAERGYNYRLDQSQYYFAHGLCRGQPN